MTLSMRESQLARPDIIGFALGMSFRPVYTILVVQWLD